MWQGSTDSIIVCLTVCLSLCGVDDHASRHIRPLWHGSRRKGWADSRRNTPSHPSALAVRSRVPRFPGSWMLSAIRTRLRPRTVACARKGSLTGRRRRELVRGGMMQEDVV